MATHSSILAWRIPWTEEPGGLPSTGSQRVGHDWVTSLSLFTFSINTEIDKLTTYNQMKKPRTSLYVCRPLVLDNSWISEERMVFAMEKKIGLTNHCIPILPDRSFFKKKKLTPFSEIDCSFNKYLRTISYAQVIVKFFFQNIFVVVV